MNLYEFSRIDEFKDLLDGRGIIIPRLRGILPAEELTMQKLKGDDVDRAITEMAVLDACSKRWRYTCISTWGPTTDRISDKYLIFGKDKEGHKKFIGVRWDKLHGKKRKFFKHFIRRYRKAYLAQCETQNKYVGRKDVMQVHARIGSWNWDRYGGPELAKQPWFLEKADDWVDCTYCDIYVLLRDEDLITNKSEESHG